VATIVSWNGSSYSVPAVGEESWGGVTKVDGLIISLATNGFQKTGGTFTLSADVDFGATAGLKSGYYKSRGTVATSGIIRLAKLEAVAWLNNAASGNNTLATDASDQLLYNGVVLAGSTGVVPVAAGGTGLTSYASGDTLYASGATTISKLAIGAASTVMVRSGAAIPSWALLVNANIDAAAAIAYSKLSLGTSILNADIAVAAAIDRSKLASGSNDHVLINSAAGVMSSEAALSPVRGGTGVANNAAATTTRSGNHALTLTTTAITGVTLPTTGTLATLLGAETLSGKTFSDALQVAEIATPATPASGFTKIYPKTDNKLYYLNDLGTETEVGAGSGGINYCTNSGADGDVSGWTTYDDAAATPVDLTAGTFNGTFARTAILPLRGTGSFLYTPAALGEGVATTITPNLADYTKPIQISFDYTFVTANAAEGDYTVWVYDVTNSQLIQPTPFKIPSGIVAGQYRWMGQFQASATGVTYRVAIHQAAATSALLKFDNVVIGPLVQVFGAPISDWTAYTPGGSFTNTTHTGFWRRAGDSMEIQIDGVLTGTPGAATFSVNLPSGYSIDTAKLSSVSTKVLGLASSLDSGTAAYAGQNVVYASTTSVNVQQIGASATWSQAVPYTWAINDRFSLLFKVPITGWGSSVVMSQDTDTRVVAARVGGDPASAADGAPIIFPSTVYDTHGAYNATTGRYTVPVAGIYNVYGFMDAGTASRIVKIYVDAVADAARLLLTDANGAMAFSAAVRVNAGQLIDIRPVGGTLDVTSNASLHFERISGPATIAASESVNCLYESDTARSISHSAATTGQFLMEDKIFDSHGSYSTTTAIFTSPVSGKYRVGAMVALAANASWDRNETLEIYLYKNGSLNRVMGGLYAQVVNTLIMETVGTTIVACLAGDTLEVRIFQNSGGAISTDATPQRNWVSYERIGN